MDKRRFLIVCRRAPYGDSLARESLDVAMAAAAFGQAVSLLFQDDGVYQLLAAQNAQAIDRKPIDAVIRALPLYEIETLYADARSLDERGLNSSQLIPSVELFAGQSLAALSEDFDVVLNF